MNCKKCNNEFTRTSNSQLYCSDFCRNENRRLNPDRKSYQVEYVSERRRETKAKAIEYLGGACSVCGYDKCQGAMDFHHKDPSEKDINIAANHRSWNKIKQELDKCILVCSNCHREIHYNQNS